MRGYNNVRVNIKFSNLVLVQKNLLYDTVTSF